jgi:hypothetical protein
MRVLLARLVFEDASPDFTKFAADALLPLILGDPASFKRVGEPHG